MTKPWEEMWTHELEATDEPRLFMVLDDRRRLVADTTSDEAAARLISAAPDLARVLLSIEWLSGGVPGTACIVCGAVRYVATDNGASQQDHAPDCALDDALRKAGVR